MAALLPPCVIVAPSSDQAATFVAKVAGHEALVTFGAAELVHGAGAFAVVHLPIQDEWYFVVSFNDVRSIPRFAAKLTKQIEQLPGAPKVAWVRAFTRRFQRLLGFGDAAATQQDLKAACEQDDIAEVTAIAPEAAAFVKARASDLSIVPAVCEGLRSGLPALQDCAHELWQERRFITVHGPCSRGTPPANRDVAKPVQRGDHNGPYTRCVKCRAIFCHFCAADVVDAAEDGKELADALELARSLPRPHDAAKIHWQQHPVRPLPFKVIDQIKIPEADKLAWIQIEIGRDEDLTGFAAKFLDLFGNKLRGDVPQKAACLKLFAAYASGGATKESDLAPTDLMAFERVWKPDAPDRCLECSTVLDAPEEGTQSSVLGRYCSDKCRNAGVTVVCTRCQGKAESVSIRMPTEVEKHLICTACDRPLVIGTDEIAKWIRNSRRSIAMLGGYFQRTFDDAHEPAWKRRRRS